MEARFLSPFAAAIAQDFAIRNKQHVRYELLEAFIQLGLAAIAVHQAGGGSDYRQIFFNFKAEALKNSQLLEQFPFKTQNSFFSRHGCNSLRPNASPQC